MCKTDSIDGHNHLPLDPLVHCWTDCGTKEKPSAGIANLQASPGDPSMEEFLLYDSSSFINPIAFQEVKTWQPGVIPSTAISLQPEISFYPADFDCYFIIKICISTGYLSSGTTAFSC